jgi:hypothetical protein
MSNDPFQRQSSTDTRQLMACMIEAREKYSIYLREVATGQRQPDSTEQELLKKKCDETVCAWREAHEACRLARLFSAGIEGL